jgi:uncharacterized protein (DUF4415 family)
MKEIAAEPYRDIDFADAKRGPVVPPEPGKTKISIRLDNRLLDYFRRIVEKAGGGNYQTLINDALVEYIQQQSMLEVVRQAVREELQPVVEQAESTKRSSGPGRSLAGRRCWVSSAGRGKPAVVGLSPVCSVCR